MGSDQTLTAQEIPDAGIRIVADVFRQVVGATAVDADADFFALGGHSLLVVEAIGLLREHHGLSVPARQFFADASVRAVAAACVPLSGADGGPDGPVRGARRNGSDAPGDSADDSAQQGPPATEAGRR
ncbi:acyl carrier protein [Streptomyces sediminimaris]|uniref:acyl carrier protein n=1 Tax=Streptomyces sediminimaris TaxID=3383721 RepID=UPI003999B1DA